VKPSGEDLMLHKQPHLAALCHKIFGVTFRHLTPLTAGKIPNEVVPH